MPVKRSIRDFLYYLGQPRNDPYYYQGAALDHEAPLPPWSQANQTPGAALLWMWKWLLNATANLFVMFLLLANVLAVVALVVGVLFVLGMWMVGAI